MFGWNVGYTWTVTGAVINHLILIITTQLVDKQMLSKKEREKIYREYMETTSSMIPWFKSKSQKTK